MDGVFSIQLAIYDKSHILLCECSIIRGVTRERSSRSEDKKAVAG